jgi:hypothetical protein
MSNPSLHIAFDDDLTSVTIFIKASTDQEERRLQEIADLMITAFDKDERGRCSVRGQ